MHVTNIGKKEKFGANLRQSIHPSDWTGTPECTVHYGINTSQLKVFIVIHHKDK